MSCLSELAFCCFKKHLELSQEKNRNHSCEILGGGSLKERYGRDESNAGRIRRLVLRGAGRETRASSFFLSEVNGKCRKVEFTGTKSVFEAAFLSLGSLGVVSYHRIKEKRTVETGGYVYS